MADLFDTTINWLLAQALGDDSFEITLEGLATRLIDGGVPIARLNVGRSLLHPVIGLINQIWDRDSGRVHSEEIPRQSVNLELLANSPFGDITMGKCQSIRADLSDPSDVARYAMFGKLAAEGLTGYLAFGERFGYRQTKYVEISEGFWGASLSFATRRFSGFSDSDAAGLARLVPAICVCARIDTERLLSTQVLEAYLGRVSGKEVLSGQIDRRGGKKINCVLFYSDMRNSIALSQQMDMDAYLALLNQYFDCTATAVLDHGGEVLKFIGDGVLAIFPFDGETRRPENMCAAALSAAREAFARARQVNAKSCDNGATPVETSAVETSPLEFGIALHVGEVIYGNVGVPKRLDFTATGAAVGLAARLEGLTRTLQHPLLASDAFVQYCPEPAQALPSQQLRGFAMPQPVHSYAVT